MGKLADALRAKYATPEAAVAALGLDAALLGETTEEQDMPQLSPRALVAKGYLTHFLKPKLAADAKLDPLDGILANVTDENWTASIPKVAAAVKTAFAPQLAQDASLDALPGELGSLPPNSAPDAPVVKPPANDAASVEEVVAWLQANGAPPEMIAKMTADLGIAASGGAPPAPPAPPVHNKPPGMDAEKDAEMGEKKDKDDLVTKPAMDEAIEAARASERERLRLTYKAVGDVAPWVGRLDAMAFDSADGVYEKTMGLLGKKVEGIHKDAWWPIIQSMPKPGSERATSGRPMAPRIAQDAAPEMRNATDAFPDLKLISRG